MRSLGNHNPHRYILALDQGTTNTTSLVFDQQGSVLATAQREIRQIFPQPGWVEHDALEIWETQLATAREAIARAGVSVDHIAGIGISNQRETTVVWDRNTGKPISHAIVWQCRRTTELCSRFRADLSQMIGEKTGLLLDPYFSGTKVRWLLDHIPGARASAQRGELLFGTIDSWLLYNLAGHHLTDISNASRTLLFNIHQRVWDEDICRALNVPQQMLPRVLPSCASFGRTRKSLFGAEIPICGVIGDQQAALFGQACFCQGEAKNTYGTGCFMLLNTGKYPVRSHEGLLTTIAWDIGDGPIYALEGSVFVAGAVVQWLRDNLGILENASDSERLAVEAGGAGGVYFVPAFVGLGAPYWDADARGTIVGLTRGTSREHITRAALESIAYQTRQLTDAMEQDYGHPIASLKADGGASANSFLMQFQADILGCPVIVPQTREITATGAAYMAGLKLGWWNGVDEIRRVWREQSRYRPTMPVHAVNQLLENWRRAVEVARSFRGGP